MYSKQIILTALFILSCLSGYSQSVSFSRSKTRITKKTAKYSQRINDKINNLNEAKSFAGKIVDSNLLPKVEKLGFQLNDIIPDSKALDSQIKALPQASPDFYGLTSKGLRERIKKIKATLNSDCEYINDTTATKIMAFRDSNKAGTDTVDKFNNRLLDNAENAKGSLKSTAKSEIKSLRENNNNRLFLPAFYSREAISFFTEKDTLASKFFSDNSLLFSSSLQKLTYGTEAYADYFGPVRLGLGYTITSSSNTKDTGKAQSDAIQKIITNGGNLNYNVNFPLFSYTSGSLFQVKASFSTKGGVDIPKDSASTSTYGYLTTTGLNVNAYSVGVLGVIQLFYTLRIAYVLGNKNFEEHVQQNSFWLWQNSIGVAVKDKFRVRFDLYSGLSGNANAQFVRSNFPVTLSFDVINPF